MKLESAQGGDGSRLLVLLHGLGATHHVWENMIAAGRWRGRWITPDLRGHGASGHAQSYAIGAHAGDVAEVIADLGPFEELIVVGHSMGGAIALAVASGWFGVAPSQVFGLGIKVAWSDEELAGLRKIAAAPLRLFDSKDEAVARYLKVSGLAGFAAPDSAAALAGVQSEGGKWRLANDPRSGTIGPPPMSALMAAARANIHLACGASDMIVNCNQLAVYEPNAVALPGGHNAMVENPGAVWDWIEERLA